MDRFIGIGAGIAVVLYAASKAIDWINGLISGKINLKCWWRRCRGKE